MKSFSVLTVSKRTGWEKLAEDSVARQTRRPKEWFVVTENKLKFRQFPAPKVIYAPKTTKPSNLNASLNAGLRMIKTDYVIFYQDFIELRPDCFEKLMDLAKPDWFVATCTPKYDDSDDSRYTGCHGIRPCDPAEWEANVALAPMKVIRELGGFDEDYDNGWSWDNVNLAERARLLGCKFYLDETNRPKLHPHEMSSHESLPPNGEWHTLTMEAIRDGTKPLRLDYL